MIKTFLLYCESISKDSKLYTQIDYNGYREGYKNAKDFSDKYSNRILDIIADYKNGNFLEYGDTPTSSFTHPKKFPSGRKNLYSAAMDRIGNILSYDELVELNYSDFDLFNIIILEYTKKGFIGNKYILYGIEMQIIENEDDWFYVKVSLYIRDRTTPVLYYKCDQFDGLLNFICDIIETKNIEDIN